MTAGLLTGFIRFTYTQHTYDNVPRWYMSTEAKKKEEDIWLHQCIRFCTLVVSYLPNWTDRMHKTERINNKNNNNSKWEESNNEKNILYIFHCFYPLWCRLWAASSLCCRMHTAPVIGTASGERIQMSSCNKKNVYVTQFTQLIYIEALKRFI